MRLTVGMTRKAKIGLGVLVVFVGAGIYFNEEIRAAVGIVRSGALEKIDPVEYQAGTTRNLEALRTAMMLYHDSEGQFPVAAGWMDAIEKRLRTNDLKEGEEKKKLHRPGFHDDKYGYAMNSACGAKYKDDVKPNTVLIFESMATIKNAVGDPTKDGAGKGITVDGKIVEVGASGQNAKNP